MKIAITGATGFVGRATVKRLHSEHDLRCWRRPESNVDFIDADRAQVDWVDGELGDPDSIRQLVEGCDAVIHSAFWRPGSSFRGSEGDVVEFCRINILGTLQLIEAAMNAGVTRFVFVSTCAVHEKILDDRPLDEAHPLWPLSHYGAHKAAIEKFVHSYGYGMGFPICAIRPTGIYGIHHPVRKSKWYEIIENIVAGKEAVVQGGGKEVHVDDVAQGIDLLLTAKDIKGHAYACYDRYISQHEVATIAKRLTNSQSRIVGEPRIPKNEINTTRIESLGMEFGGKELLERTVQQLIQHVQVN